MLGFEDIGGGVKMYDTSAWMGYTSGALDGSNLLITSDAAAPNGTGACAAIMLTDTKGIFVWHSQASYAAGHEGANTCYFTMFTVNGANISVGVTYSVNYDFYSVNGGSIRLFPMTGNRVGMFCSARPGGGFSCCCGVITYDLNSGVLSCGSIAQIGSHLGIFAGQVNDSQFIFYDSNARTGIGTVSGSAVTWAQRLSDGVRIYKAMRIDDTHFAATVNDNNVMYFRVYSLVGLTLTQLSSFPLSRINDDVFQLARTKFARVWNNSAASELNIDPDSYAVSEDFSYAAAYSPGGGGFAVPSPDGRCLLVWKSDSISAAVKAIDFRENLFDTGVYVSVQSGASAQPVLQSVCPTPSGKTVILCWAQSTAAFLKVIRCSL